MPRLWILAVGLAGVLVLAACRPGVARAHGPVAPVALDYRAQLTAVPKGVDAKVVDGDLRMWLSVPSRETVVVLDYEGAPYLRFSRSGVAVNHASEMFYLNQTPFPLTVPAGLGPHTRPRWKRASPGHAYGWHDGRLHALAAVALAPGASLVGRWRVPIVVDGHLTAITGKLWHAGSPSIVWFWPIVVLLLCVLAARRVRQASVDRWTARALALAELAALAAAAVGRELHGRPGVSPFQLVELALLLGFVGWMLLRIARGRAGWFTYFAIVVVALWEGVGMLPTLLDGFVLLAVPAFVARSATVIALGGGAASMLMVFRLFDLAREAEGDAGDTTGELDPDDVWELA